MILPSRATLIGFAVLGLALLAAIGTAKWFHHEAQAARAERDAVQAQLDTAVDANQSQATTIDTQTRALAKWAALGKTPEQLQQLVTVAHEREKTYEQIAKENSALKAKDRNLPDCIRLLQISLRERCPGRALVLRRAADSYEDGRSGNSNSGRSSITAGTSEGLRAEVPIPIR